LIWPVAGSINRARAGPQVQRAAGADKATELRGCLQAGTEAGVQKDRSPQAHSHPEQGQKLLNLGRAHPSRHQASLPQHWPVGLRCSARRRFPTAGPDRLRLRRDLAGGRPDPSPAVASLSASTHGDHWSRPSCAPERQYLSPCSVDGPNGPERRYSVPMMWRLPEGMAMMLELRRADRRFQGTSATRLSRIACRSGPIQGRRSRNGPSGCDRPQALSTAAALPTPRSRSSCSRLPRTALASPKTIEVFASSKRSFLMPE